MSDSPDKARLYGDIEVTLAEAEAIEAAMEAIPNESGEGTIIDEDGRAQKLLVVDDGANDSYVHVAEVYGGSNVTLVSPRNVERTIEELREEETAYLVGTDDGEDPYGFKIPLDEVGHALALEPLGDNAFTAAWKSEYDESDMRSLSGHGGLGDEYDSSAAIERDFEIVVE